MHASVPGTCLVTSKHFFMWLLYIQRHTGPRRILRPAALPLTSQTPALDLRQRLASTKESYQTDGPRSGQSLE